MRDGRGQSLFARGPSCACRFLVEVRETFAFRGQGGGRTAWELSVAGHHVPILLVARSVLCGHSA